MTRVISDDAQRCFGDLGAAWQKAQGGDALVKTEDVVFEQYFKVLSTDQVEARYILSLSLMKRLTALREKAGCLVSATFTANRVNILFKTKKDFFEPRLFHTLLDFEPVRAYYAELALAFGIAEELDLNTRIWTKE